MHEDKPTVQCDRKARIRQLNDRLRRTGVGGQILLTRGIAGLPVSDQASIITKVRNFSDFNEDNDPHAEHDFGAFDYESQRIFWKVDYYDCTLAYGSEDPADPSKTRRVLTILLAEEY